MMLNILFSRADEQSIMLMTDAPPLMADQLSSDDEYDVGLQDEADAIESIEIERSTASASQDPLADDTDGDQLEENTCSTNVLEIESVDDADASSSAAIKGEPFNLLMMSTSLDAENSNASDCQITAVYSVEYADEDDNNDPN